MSSKLSKLFKWKLISRFFKQFQVKLLRHNCLFYVQEQSFVNTIYVLEFVFLHMPCHMTLTEEIFILCSILQFLKHNSLEYEFLHMLCHMTFTEEMFYLYVWALEFFTNPLSDDFYISNIFSANILVAVVQHAVCLLNRCKAQVRYDIVEI